VQFAEGRSYEVTEIYAWDRKLDLAVVRVAATNLPVLALGDSDLLKQGTAIVAMGNPLGLKHSIVQGVVSARRDFDGVEMIQLAIPIEPGNSGGPLLDMQARVHGLLTLKSAMTANLGFAMPINQLKPLLARPNPIPIERWVRIGALNTNDWLPLFGARWTQKSGRLHAEHPGNGFGGRSLCLWQQPVPPRPYEIAVMVRLEEESGAAGLVFGSDGEQKHYGFYPSAGQLRLTRFDGPNVLSWTILEQAPSIYYRRGEWNTLKVRQEEHKILCYVNDHLAMESTDDGLPDGKVGLAKFRDTAASFKNFQVGTNIPAATGSVLSLEAAAALSNAVERVSATQIEELAATLESQGNAVPKALGERAAQLEQQAAELRHMASALRRQTVQRQLVAALADPEQSIDLFHAALLISKLDNAELDIDAYRRQLEEMARDLRKKFKAGADVRTRLSALHEFLFAENGFHGSRSDFYNRANSYLNEVLDEREGLPITLAILFIELGHRIGLTELVGIPVPGIFMVRYTRGEEEDRLIDVFHEGKTVTREEVDEMVQENTGSPLTEAALRPAKKREIIIRMLRNLHSVAQQSETGAEALRYLDLIVALAPDSSADHFDRARLRMQIGDRAGAKQDFKWILDNAPAGVDLESVREFIQSL
jgi:regulator of sirC expression with transglutaminase-like and TPR domain